MMGSGHGRTPARVLVLYHPSPAGDSHHPEVSSSHLESRLAVGLPTVGHGYGPPGIFEAASRPDSAGPACTEAAGTAIWAWSGERWGGSG